MDSDNYCVIKKPPPSYDFLTTDFNDDDHLDIISYDEDYQQHLIDSNHEDSTFSISRPAKAKAPSRCFSCLLLVALTVVSFLTGAITTCRWLETTNSDLQTPELLLMFDDTIVAPSDADVALLLLADEITNGKTGRNDPNPSPYNKGLHDEHCHPLSKDKTNIHIIAHSHDDVGWLKTVDQYFYGERNDIQNAGVQYIIDGVVQALDANPDRKYVQVEMAFLARWWRRQSDSTKDKFRRFLRNGQLEIVCGGWSMADEATPDYASLIDEHTIGFDFIRREIDPEYRPLVAWQVDPFGHSREFASLSAEMGMNGLYFARLDYQDRKERERNKTTELVWKLRPSTPENDLDLFTSTLARSTYCPPEGFSFDVGSNDPPIMDDPRLEGYNADRRVALFEAIMRMQRDVYPTRNLMVTMGCDFNYVSASSWFLNLDALIRTINNMSTEFHAFYSTPSCYTRAVHDQLKEPLATKRDDFFPYADSEASFWTGYFSSRPSLKRLVRELGNSYGTIRQLLAISKMPVDDQVRSKLDYIEDTVGVLQHHDGITGTSRQHVTNDARKRSAKAIDFARNISSQVYKTLLCQPNNKNCVRAGKELSFCPLLNESSCQFTENNSQNGFSVIVYNRLAETFSTWLRLPLNLANPSSELVVTVTDSAGERLPVDIVPIVASDIGSIPTRQNSKANIEAVFKATVPPLGTSVFFVRPKQFDSDGQKKSTLKNKMMATGQTFENGQLRLTLDDRGYLVKLENVKEKVSVDFRHTLAFYQTQLPPGPTSGAYRFTPDASGLHFFEEDEGETLVVPGQQVTEIHRQHSSWAKSIYRLYKDEPYLEIQWIVGQIPINLANSKTPDPKTTLGREVVSLFETSIKNDGIFYTDANGREMLERRRDFRPTWALKGTQNVSQNYYPIVSRISTKDKTAQMTLVTDRAQGASGFRPGSLEVMVHRRLTYDDNFGVSEPLMETEDDLGLVASGRILVLLNSPSTAARNYRKVSQAVMFQPSLAFSPISTLDKWQEAGFTEKTTRGRSLSLTSDKAVEQLLPPNIHLLTLERDFSGCTLMLRLEHIFEAGEDSTYSQATQVRLLRFVQGLLGGQSAVDPDQVVIEELALGANMALEELVRLKWPTATKRDQNAPEDLLGSRMLERHRQRFGANWDTIVMKPMQIRTFCASLA